MTTALTQPTAKPVIQAIVFARHEIMSRGLTQMLAATDVVEVAATTCSVEETLQARKDASAEVLVVPSELEEKEAEAVVASGARVLVIVGARDLSTLPRALLGAHGFVIETSLTVDRLERAVQDVLDGEGAMPRSLVASLIAEAPTGSEGRVESRYALTPREDQVLQLLGDGLSNKEIGRSLRISEHGAKRYVANILVKLDCPNRTVAVARAMKQGMLKTAD